jgi:hypothetical protein
MKIFVAIPTYDGKLDVRVAGNLMTEQNIARAKGHEFDVRFLPGCSHPAMGRNQLVQEFLDSKFDKLFFLDSDITWEPGTITYLCHMPREFVGACYRYKKEHESYPLGWLPDPDGKGLYSDELGLIEVANLPGGFCALSRQAFERIQDFKPNKIFRHFGMKAYCHYEMRFENGNLWGEDAGFCKEFREAGGKVYLKPDVSLTHWDFRPTPYEGNLGNWLGGKRPIPEKDSPLKFHEPVLECGMSDEELILDKKTINTADALQTVHESHEAPDLGHVT